jgi:hypothetical protein
MELVKTIYKFLGKNVEFFIACSALGLVIWQGLMQRHHNRLSVRPYLCSNRNISIDDLLMSISVLNSGIGPAIVKKSTFYFDKERIDEECNSHWDKIRNRLNNQFTLDLTFDICRKSAIDIGHAGEVIILEIQINDKLKKHENAYEIAKKELDRIRIELEYESMYGEKFTRKI